MTAMRIGYDVEYRKRHWWWPWSGRWVVGFRYSDGFFDVVASYKNKFEAELAAERMARV